MAINVILLTAIILYTNAQLCGCILPCIIVALMIILQRGALKNILNRQIKPTYSYFHKKSSY